MYEEIEMLYYLDGDSDITMRTALRSSCFPELLVEATDRDYRSPRRPLERRAEWPTVM
jgi:hypothetical protein